MSSTTNRHRGPYRAASMTLERHELDLLRRLVRARGSKVAARILGAGAGTVETLASGGMATAKARDRIAAKLRELAPVYGRAAGRAMELRVPVPASPPDTLRIEVEAP